MASVFAPLGGRGCKDPLQTGAAVTKVKVHPDGWCPDPRTLAVSGRRRTMPVERRWVMPSPAMATESACRLGRPRAKVANKVVQVVAIRPGALKGYGERSSKVQCDPV